MSLDSTPADIAVGRANNRLVVAVITDSIVIIRDGRVATKHQVRYQPTSVGLSIDETHIAVGGKDNKIHLYNLSGDRVSDGPVLDGHRGPLTTVTFSPDGKWLASADHNRDIFVWDLANKTVSIYSSIHPSIHPSIYLSLLDGNEPNRVVSFFLINNNRLRLKDGCITLLVLAA